MANDINLLTSNSADILLNVVAIAKKYNLDISKDTFARTGNFAYLTELSAKIIQNSILSKQIDFNELFASTAINPLSLINLCRSFNIDVTTATPAYGDLELTINLNDASSQQYTYIKDDGTLLEMYGQEITSLPTDNAIIIDRGTKFQIGGYNFYIEKSIAIWQDGITGRWVAKYLTTERQRTSFQNMNDAYLNTKIRIVNNITYLTIFPKAYQFEIQELQKLIHKSEIIYTSVINFNYTDNYIGSRLFYSLNNNNGSKQEINLSNSIVNRDPFVEAFGGRLSITFPNDLNTFRPSANSILILETYVSKGSRGNLNFSKPLSIIQNEKSTHKYQMIAYMKGGITYGGSDEPTVNQLRNLFINQVSSRNIISTASDLNLYFSKLKDLVRTVSNSDVLFIKKRDDILKRYYDAFILFRDNKNYSVDTNTADATIYNNDISNNYLSSVIPTYTFKSVRFYRSFSGTNIKYGHAIIPPNNVDDTAVFYDEASGTLNADNDYYIVPFYIHATTTPINSVHYIFNRTNQSSELTINRDSATSNSGSSVWLYPTEALLERTGLDQDYYNVRFYFETSRAIVDNEYDYYLNLYQVGNSILSSTKMSPVDITNREYENTTTGDKVNYVDLSFKIDVNTDREFDFGDTISLNLNIDGIKQVFSDIKFKLEIREQEQTSSVMSVETGYMSMFIDLQDVMYSDLKVDRNSTNELIDYIDIYDVPCVHKSYLDSNKNDMSFFISQMFTFIELLKESQQNIDQSEMVNVKFYRTYGVSEIYNVVRTNLDLKLDIMTKLTTVAEAKALVDAIRVFIDSYNVSKIFRYSDLVTDIMNSDLGSYIYNIIFNGMNGTWEQSIEMINTSDIYYPEYFNIVGDALKSIRIWNYNPRTKESRMLLGKADKVEIYG